MTQNQRAPNWMLPLFVLTGCYLVFELSFSARLLDISGLSLDPNLIAGVEQSGRLISGFAVALAFWGIFLLKALENRGLVVNVMMMVLTGALIIPTIYFAEKALVDHIVKYSSASERHEAIYSTFLRKELLDHHLTLSDIDSSTKYLASPDGKAFIALIPFLATRVSDLSSNIPNRLDDLLTQEVEAALGDPTNFYQENFVKSVDALGMAYAEYRQGTARLNQAIASIPERQLNAWDQYCADLRARRLQPGNINAFESISVRRKVRQTLPVPKDWNPNDQTTFYEAVATKVRQDSYAAFESAVQQRLGLEEGAMLPDTIDTLHDFTLNSVVQQNWRNALQIEDSVVLRPDMNVTEFEAVGYDPLVKRLVAQQSSIFRSKDSDFADGGKYELQGRKAMEGVIAPPLALFFSISGALVHIVKFLMFGLELSPLRNKTFRFHKKVTLPGVGMIVVCIGLALTTAIGLAPSPVTSSRHFRENIYPKLKEAEGPEIAGILKWIIKAERYAYPFNNWLRFNILFNYQFPRLWGGMETETPGGKGTIHPPPIHNPTAAWIVRHQKFQPGYYYWPGYGQKPFDAKYFATAGEFNAADAQITQKANPPPQNEEAVATPTTVSLTEASNAAEARAGFERAQNFFGMGQYDMFLHEYEQAVKTDSNAPAQLALEYTVAATCLQQGELSGQSAAHFLDSYSRKTGNGDASWPLYAALYGYSGYRQAGEENAAKQMIERVVSKGPETQWPFPIISYLHGDLKESELDSLVGNNRKYAMESKAFIGIKQLYDQDREDAINDLVWVAEFGIKSDWEYNLAISELRHLENPGLKGQALLPTVDERNQAQHAFEQAEFFWRNHEFTNSCDHFVQAFTLYPVPPYTPLCHYVAACTYIGRGGSAGKFARLLLATFGWNRLESPADVLFGYAGFLQSGDAEDAKQLLNEGAERCETTRWPYSLIVYLQGRLDAQTLFSQMGNNRSQLTEARTLIGIKQLYDGDRSDALQNLIWVKTYGQKGDPTYDLALTEVSRIQPPPPTP